jgi:survival motor neuron protein
MSENSNLLFSRLSANKNDDVWDDSALVRAYEKAVGKIKHDLNRNLAVCDNGSGKHTREKNDKKTRKKEKIRKNTEDSDENNFDSCSVRDWKVGDECYAVYEDGFMYPGKIIEINEEDHTCLIRYDYYDNEEEKDLDELYDTAADHYESFKDVISETELDDGPKVREKKKKDKKKKNLLECDSTTANIEFAIPPPPPPPLIDQPMFANLANIYACKNTDADDYDAFYAMLMSWYISGYHTGFYLGKVQNQAEKNPGK